MNSGYLIMGVVSLALCVLSYSMGGRWGYKAGLEKNLAKAHKAIDILDDVAKSSVARLEQISLAINTLRQDEDTDRFFMEWERISTLGKKELIAMADKHLAGVKLKLIKPED